MDEMFNLILFQLYIVLSEIKSEMLGRIVWEQQKIHKKLQIPPHYHMKLLLLLVLLSIVLYFERVSVSMKQLSVVLSSFTTQSHRKQSISHKHCTLAVCLLGIPMQTLVPCVFTLWAWRWGKFRLYSTPHSRCKWGTLISGPIRTDIDGLPPERDHQHQVRGGTPTRWLSVKAA